jgi:outer membrane lipoprotein carrier protein
LPVVGPVVVPVIPPTDSPAVPAGDEPARAALQAMLKGLHSLQGRFEQEVRATDGELLDSSAGQFRLLQPGYFSWHIESPDEQLLLAANNSLWHYDVELETATRRDITGAEAGSPLAILSGDERSLREHYRVEQLAEAQFRLYPYSTRASFYSVTLDFSDGLPVAMTVVDRLQQETRIQFNQLESNPGLSADDFLFTPPAGVDVYQPQR